MPATTLRYENTIDVNLAAQTVNLADASVSGHRVQVDVSSSTLNGHFKWSRAVGDARPHGFVDTPATFNATLVSELSAFTDIDAGHLNLSAGVLADPEMRTDSMNDLILQYILFKVYGVSNYDTRGVVYNVGDALNLVTNQSVADAITTDISGNNEADGAVDQMFRDLLMSDPGRFFDASGQQIPGLFETNSDVSGNGTWLIDGGDIIEIKLEFTFVNKVTRKQASGQNETPVEETVIPAGHKMHVRLQLVAV